MKKNFLLLFTLPFLSCSKDEAGNENLLLGKWFYKEKIVNGVVIPYDDHEVCGKDYIDFYSPTQVKSIDIFDCEEITDWNGTYTKEDTSININVNGVIRALTILDLRQNFLEVSYEIDTNGDGINETQIEKFEK